MLEINVGYLVAFVEVSSVMVVAAVAQIESPLKKVVPSAVPDANLAVGTVPVKLDAGTDPEKLVAVMIPVVFTLAVEINVCAVCAIPEIT